MDDPLIFNMGKYEAKFPTDRLYARNHLWMQPIAGGPDRYRVGFSGYAVRLLQDVYFLEWSIHAGDFVVGKQDVGEVESAKAVSNLYSPAAGTVLTLNPAVMNDPAL
ncbi:MAG: glycine cleavage system protein H, partial [Planctomycetia bacterium]